MTDVMVGVDIGGTKVAAGRVSRDGALVAEPRTAPSDTRGPDETIAGIALIVSEVVAEAAAAGETVAGVGIGCAGTIDHARGVVVVSPHLPLVEAPLAERVAQAVGLPTLLDNDANVAALAETRVGAARGARHVVMFTLGTGVGGGLVLDGRLYRGCSGAAAELGHTIVAAGGEPCHCGGRGCLEAYASGRALERIYGGSLSGVEVGALALAGDARARAAVEEVGRWLGIGLANATNTFNPEVIVVGGGVSALGELVLAPARQVLAEVALRPSRDQVSVVPAVLGNSAGVVGAALAAWEAS